jgi:pyruvoyl-dependent arginine decarboxylase (PvlArgDC)
VPDQVDDVPKLMQKYKGKEAALYAAMLKKYEITDGDEFFAAMVPPDEETPDEDEEDEEESQPGEDVAAPEPAPEPASVAAESAPAAAAKAKPRKELSVGDIRERVTYVYEQKNPEKLKDMRKLMIKFRGREKLFYRAIKAKYEVNEQFFADEFGDDDDGENENGQAAVASSEALAEAEAARAERAAALEAAVEAGETIQWTPVGL